MIDLSGKVALVTGASRGIGSGIAERLAGQGACVVVNYRTSAQGAEATVERIRQSGGEAVAIQADVSQSAEAQGLIKEAIAAWGGLDILVNNAGTTRDMVIMMLKEDDWDTVIQTNLTSTFYCSKAAVRHMMRKRYGRIVNITSVVGLAGQSGQTNYAASKAGMIGFTKSLAKEVGSRGITVNAVAPGFVPTALTDVLSDEQKAQAIDMTPLGRLGTVEDVANAVVFLASDEACFITGQVLSVDGGLVMQ
jgi:3-oxoacyl-[acyl-carrier protein] reductase